MTDAQLIERIEHNLRVILGYAAEAPYGEAQAAMIHDRVIAMLNMLRHHANENPDRA